MKINRLLIANRGEIAIRIARSAALAGIESAGLTHELDQSSRHCEHMDVKIALPNSGITAYLDIDNIVALAQQNNCDAVHPGYGFLSESAKFAAAVTDAGLLFVGPEAATLALFGNKITARAFARRQGVPVVEGAEGDLEAIKVFLKSLAADQKLILKASAGGGGRGMRLVFNEDELAVAWPRCQSEAGKAFGSNQLYGEAWLPAARHIEIQILGDCEGHVSHLWERDCTIQRRFQKIIEIAPAPHLPAAMRDQLIDAALTLAAAHGIRTLATFEFLVDQNYEHFFFMEANPRLQVEHTVTEAVTGVDLVTTQIQLATGMTLKELKLDRKQTPAAVGYAVQTRINAERIVDNSLIPTSGTVEQFVPAIGPGIRVDSQAYNGCVVADNFDSLLAKLIVHDRDGFAEVIKRTSLALKEFRIDGIETTIELLRAVLQHPDVLAGKTDNLWLDQHLKSLTKDIKNTNQLIDIKRKYNNKLADTLTLFTDEQPALGASAPAAIVALSDDPNIIAAAMQGTIVAVEAAPQDEVKKGAPLLIMDAMKMEHIITAPYDGMIQAVYAEVGKTVAKGHGLMLLLPMAVVGDAYVEEVAVDVTLIRPDLQEVLDRHAVGLDKNRPVKMARRYKTGHRSARQNIADICDKDSFVEYGPLVIAAQRRRRTLEDLIENTPADGMLAGLCSINGSMFPGTASRCILISYDYTVLAGTQGGQNHRKKDRLFALAEQMRCPVVCFAEGGGGRPGDTDTMGVAGLDCLAFNFFAKLSALVPLVGITTGRCFAGNAALLGCCDVIIATEDANIGMGGPAMIEGGGLGVFRPEEIGPTAHQAPNGVIDILVKDEAEAVKATRKYLSYFQGNLPDWQCQDQHLLRAAIPENRLRIYDIYHVINTLADVDSVLELRQAFGVGMITVFARFEGRPIGIIANNPAYLAGAINSDGADKATRFMQLCDAFDLPLLFLCDCPGIMVGPEAEKTALVRHASRMFVAGANLSVPFFTIILRKAYGLGAQAMAGGSFKVTNFTISWPTGEFGGMGLEGAVKLGYRKELEAVKEPEKRRQLWQEMVARMYRHGKAVNVASTFEIDDVIDPADSRKWIMAALQSAPAQPPREGKKRPCVDTW